VAENEYRRRPLEPDAEGNLLPVMKPEQDERDDEEDFDPEWFLCQTSVSLVGRLHIKDRLKTGEGMYGRQCFFSLRTKKLAGGRPITNYFMIKVFGNDMVSVVEKLPNGTFIRVTGNLERWRDTTYIRAQSIVPQLDLEKQAEEMMRRHVEENAGDPENGDAEAEMVRGALGRLAEKTREVVDVGFGDGGGILSGGKKPDEKSGYGEKNRNEHPGRNTPPPETEKRRPVADDEGRDDDEEGDERIMSSKEDLAYILNILEEMEENDGDDEESGRFGGGRTGSSSGQDDEYDDDGEDDAEDESVLVVDVKNGTKTGEARMTYAEAERKTASEKLGEEREQRRRSAVREGRNAPARKTGNDDLRTRTGRRDDFDDDFGDDRNSGEGREDAPRDTRGAEPGRPAPQRQDSPRPAPRRTERESRPRRRSAFGG